jgi:hypothetical protein
LEAVEGRNAMQKVDQEPENPSISTHMRLLGDFHTRPPQDLPERYRASTRKRQVKSWVQEEQGYLRVVLQDRESGEKTWMPWDIFHSIFVKEGGE